MFPIADGTVKLSGGDQVLRTSTLIRDSPDRGEEQDNLRGEPDGSSSTARQDSSWYDGEAGSDFLVHFRQFYLPSSRGTQSQTVRADWRIIPSSTTIHRRNQGNKYDLGCDAWTSHRRLLEMSKDTETDRIHTIHQIGRKTSTWSAERLTKKQTRSRPDFLWPEIWNDMSEAKWAIEKPKLDNAGRLRGIYFIDPAGAEFKETIKTARRKLEVPMPASMPCKIRGGKYRETCRTPRARKTKYACICRSRRIYEKALGRNSTQRSWRPHCREMNQFNEPLQSCA